MDITLDKATTWRLELLSEITGQPIEAVAARGLTQWVVASSMQLAERLGGALPPPALANGKARQRAKQKWRKKRDHRNLSVKELNAIVSSMERKPEASFVAQGKLHGVSGALARTLGRNQHPQQKAGKVIKVSKKTAALLPCRG